MEEKVLSALIATSHHGQAKQAQLVEASAANYSPEASAVGAPLLL
jgi:hypothetical protein